MTAPITLILVGDPAVAERLEGDLRGQFLVRVAGSSDRAGELLEQEDVGVVIADRPEVCAALRAVAPELPIVYLGEGDVHVWRALRLPWDPVDLAAVVRNAIEHRALHRERDALAVLNELSASAVDVASHTDLAVTVSRTLPRIFYRRFDVAATLLAGLGEQVVLHLDRAAKIDDEALAGARDHAVELFGMLSGRSVRKQLAVQVTGPRRGTVPPVATRSVIHAPLTVDGRVVGIIVLIAFRESAFGSGDGRLLELLARQTGEALRRLSTRLSDERRRMSLMVQSMADGVIMTDEEGEVFLINPGAKRMLGVESPLEAPITSKYLKERLGFYPFDLVARGSADPVREEVRVGGKILHSIVSPVVDGTGKIVGVVVVLRDITEWRELDRRKEEFVSIVSHELRTPLTSIAGALDIVLKQYAGGVSDKQRRYLEMARESCSKLHTIVDALLDVARFERGKMAMQFRAVSLDDLARGCVDRFRAAAEAKQVSLVFSATSGADERAGRAFRAYQIWGDPDRLTQVLNNLLSNAIKFTPDGGRIEIEAFGPSVARQAVGVSVWNNGEPIPERDRERVFDKFEQVQASTTRRVGGTGLGLAISRSIVEGHGGKIWVENTPAGTKFVFTLPAAPATEEEGPFDDTGGFPLDFGTMRGEPAASGHTVLVVDDDRYTTYILKGVLMAAGHRVLVSHDPDDALQVAREKKPDLITVDAMLPGVDGLALVEILKHDPDTRKAAIVVISMALERDKAIGAGADAYLAKPVDVEVFRDTCARLITERGRARAVKVLVVDDDADIRMICREVLEAAGYVVREASDGQAALLEAKRFRPDLMLLDVMMPDLDGFQTAQRFRGDGEGSLTPVIFVSARGQTADKVRAFKLGADDYLVKPFDAAELVARVEKALERRDRELGASPTTKLPGSSAIEAEIERRLRAGMDLAFCYLDLDNLKAFNDYYGYAKADGVIRQTGDLVREVVAREGAPGDFIGHIAGDDFVLITDVQRVDRICQTICRSFDRLAPLYYNKADRERGYIETLDRYGELRRFPIMTVSIAAVTTGTHPFKTYAEIATSAAEAKQVAKSIAGSSYVKDPGSLTAPKGKVISAT